MKSLLIAALAVMLWNTTVHAQTIAYKADNKNGSVTFAGKHAGKEFTGTFGEWNASVQFSADDIGASRIEAVFNTAAAKTGNAMFDGALPQADWFDSKNHEQAKFVGTTIRAIDAANGQYATDGELTIRGITKPISFEFTMTDPTISPVSVKATIPVKRMDYNIGAKSDATAEWVDEIITITLDFQAITAE